MIDRDVLIEKTNSIQNCLKRIHETVQGDIDRLFQLDVQDIVVLNLQRAVQQVIDIASYIVANERFGVPNSLKDIFVLLEKNHFVAHELSQKMQKMVGFRNIAVHDNAESDSKIELCQGGALNLSQRSGAEAAKHNMFSDAGGLKFSGCPTPTETIFQSRAAYQSIDLEILQKIVSHHLADLEEFYTAIIQKSIHK